MEPVTPSSDFASMYGMRSQCVIYDDTGNLIGDATICADFPQIGFSEVTQGLFDQQISRRGIIDSSAVAVGYKIQFSAGGPRYNISEATVVPEYGISLVTLTTDRYSL